MILSPPNYRAALHAATALCLHTGRVRRGASAHGRYAHVKKLLALAVFVLAIGSLQAKVFTGEHRNSRFTVHGRISCYNGGSTFRIWIVGSKRVLYVAGDNTPALDAVSKILGDGDGWFTRDLFADFTVEPLEPDIKGHMRPVRILAVKQVVVTESGKVIAKKEHL